MAQAARSKKSNISMIQSKKASVPYYTVNDVMAMQGCCRRTAQQRIKDLNDELKKKGYRTYPAGKVSRTYYDEQYY